MRRSSGMLPKTNSSQVRHLFPASASHLPEMPEPNVHEFSKLVTDLFATRGTDVFGLSAQLDVDPVDLLQMTNG
jgi:hypothetical protein